MELRGQIGGIIAGAKVAGSYAYMAVGYSLAILDVSNSASPTLVGQSSILADKVLDIALGTNLAYLAISAPTAWSSLT